MKVGRRGFTYERHRSCLMHLEIARRLLLAPTLPTIPLIRRAEPFSKHRARSLLVIPGSILFIEPRKLNDTHGRRRIELHVTDTSQRHDNSDARAERVAVCAIHACAVRCAAFTARSNWGSLLRSQRV